MGNPQALIVISSDKEEDEQQVMAQGNEEVKEDVESLEEPSDWLPDGWIMEIYHNDDGTFNKYYISPVSGCTFTTQSDVMKHLFSATDERILKAKETAEKNQFMRTHDWLPKGWQLEIRAGGKNMDKMYKFFLDPQAGVRLQSKEDILANVELNPDELLKGWVKEVAFRRTEKGLKKHLVN
ncbi:hypothetical protein PR202_gb08494 [Eleusine coracana subsp. coracana]|uniref:MBD domain-containing protein n=1 Tax=Eleusine coracana subsp. coracana TaxID=191504 RepID=A0AAV5EED3_ELECO|nr:hypothetical protein PR202_gb08494 [Eleusine coracana subsp. coracana]